MNKQVMMKQDQIEDKSAGPPPADKTPPPNPEGNPPPLAPSEKTGDFDEFGYEKPKAEENKEAPKDPKEKKAEDKKPEGSTGYDLIPPEAPKETPEKKDPPVVPDPEKKVEEELKIDTKGLDDKDVAKIKAFAKENKLTQEQAQKFVDLKKSEVQDFETARNAFEVEEKARGVEIKRGWHQELKADPDFGGEKFEKSLLQVEKVLNEFLPGTKKVLTETKTMLSPTIMKDLAKLADKLYTPERFVQGEAGSPPPEKVEESTQNDPLAFYQ